MRGLSFLGLSFSDLGVMNFPDMGLRGGGGGSEFSRAGLLDTAISFQIITEHQAQI